MRGVSGNGGVYSSATWLKDYVRFMTTAGSHNDTYAESFHRDFFKNWRNGTAPEACARGTEAHNTAQIGGFVVRPLFCAAPRIGGLVGRTTLRRSAALWCAPSLLWSAAHRWPCGAHNTAQIAF